MISISVSVDWEAIHNSIGAVYPFVVAYLQIGFALFALAGIMCCFRALEGNKPAMRACKKMDAKLFFFMVIFWPLMFVIMINEARK